MATKASLEDVAARPKRIGLIGAHPSRGACGAFVGQLRAALEASDEELTCAGVFVGDGNVSAAGGLTIEVDGLARAADYLRFAGVEALALQHDFTCFPPTATAPLMAMLDRVARPLVVTFRDVPTHPEPGERAALQRLARRAGQVVVLSRKASEILSDTYGVSVTAEVVPSGVEARSIPAAAAKARLELGGRRVLMTVGSLSPATGIEVMIEAMPAIVAAHPDVVYAVVGRARGALGSRADDRADDSYAASLRELAVACGVAEHVRFIARDPSDAVCEVLAAADLYVSPYLSEAELSSHTLASAFAMGKPVIATPFWYARELLGSGRGTLVAFGNPAALAERTIALLGDRAELARVARRARDAGRALLWPQVAKRYLRLLASAAAAYDRRTPVSSSAVTG